MTVTAVRKEVRAKLYQHQIDGLAYIQTHRRVLLADEPGTGKTAIGLTALVEHPGVSIVVCKGSLRPNFAEEMDFWFPDVHYQVVLNKTEIDPTAELFIVAFNTLPVREHELRALNPSALLVDESHYLKNEETQRTKAAFGIATEVLTSGNPLIIAASATPGVSRPEELVAQLLLLGRLPEIAPTPDTFRHRYCGPRRVNRGSAGSDVWDFKGHSNLEELRHRLYGSRIVLRRRKSEVLELPPKTSVVNWVETTGPEWNEYWFARDEFVQWLRSTGKRVSDSYHPQVIEQMTALRRLAGEAKAHEVGQRAIRRRTEDRSPLVIMAHHRSVVETLEQHLSGEGFIVGKIIGGQSDKKRREHIHAFQNGDQDVIVCALEAAAEGLTLTASHEEWMVELPFVPGRLQQAEDRTHRVGQTLPVTIRYMLARGTIDVRMRTALKTKAEVLHEMFDGELRVDDEPEAPTLLDGPQPASVIGAVSESYIREAASIT